MANVSVNDAALNGSPARTDPVLGISDTAVPESWALRRILIKDILALIIDADIPSTIARDSELTSFLTLTGTQNVSNKTFTTLTNFSAGIALGGTTITATAANLNTLAGHLTLLDAITASAAEINKTDGLTASTAELNILAGSNVSASEFSVLDGLTAGTAELNILDGVTATATDLNVLAGTSVVSAEFEQLAGLTAVTAELNTLAGFNGDVDDLNDMETVFDSVSPASLIVVSESVYFRTLGTGKTTFNVYIPAPAAGTIDKINYITNEAIAGGSSHEITLTPSIGGVDITGGAVTFDETDPPGTVVTVSPSAAKTVAADGVVRFTVSMTSGAADFPLLSGTAIIYITRTRS